MARDVVGVILAGGLARRMGGGDKALKLLAGRTLLDRTIERARPQVAHLVLNANGDPVRFHATGLTVVPDSLSGFLGPLAGVLAALDWAAERHPACSTVASFATDAPFFPLDLVARLEAGRRQASQPLACARSAGQVHPVFGLWPVNLRGDLRRALEAGERKIDRWTAKHGIALVDFAAEPSDPFFNVNTPDDLSRAEALVAVS